MNLARSPLLLLVACQTFILQAPASALCGDCNLDGVVNVVDVLRASHHATGLLTLSGLEFDNCDVSPTGGDGTVDVLDMLLIAQRAVGLLPGLACASGVTCPPATPNAMLLDTVVSYDPGPQIDFGHADPYFAVNGVTGGGCCTGSLDVCSLGSSGSGWGGQLTLRLSGQLIVNGPGNDFVIYENPFYVGGAAEGAGFIETGVVEVSEDGVVWVRFPVLFDDTYPVNDRRRYARGFCGVEPVYLRTDLGMPPATAAGGGDFFDLAEVGLCAIRYIRIRDTAQVYPDANFPPGDCDIDGVAAIYTTPDP